MMFLMDACRIDDRIAVWVKGQENDTKIELPWTPNIFLPIDPLAKKVLERLGLEYFETRRKDYLHRTRPVYCVRIGIKDFESRIRSIERAADFRLPIFNADITPELGFAIHHDVRFCHPMIMHEPESRRQSHSFRSIQTDSLPAGSRFPDLSILEVSARLNSIGKLTKVTLNKKSLEGDQKDLLQRFASVIKDDDPDLILMDHAYSILPILVARCEAQDVPLRLDRFGHTDIKRKEGRVVHSYNQVKFQDAPIKLKGRFLIDSSSNVWRNSGLEGLFELCQLSGAQFQSIASRSFGFAFQQALLRNMASMGILIPYKQKPIPPMMSLLELVKADRAGHTFDPKIGFHKDVAELDFSSMYPWIIFNHNISAETILSKDPPLHPTPQIGIPVSHRRKGLVPLTIKPFLDRRMECKSHPDSKVISKALKWVLVTSYGYLRFREFKLGIAQSHMAVGAYSRDIILKSKEIAESHDFDLIHGIVDSLYLRKDEMANKDILSLCEDIHLKTGIPISFEGIFKWVVFLPSINDPTRPVPARYFGVFKDGTLKVRGIELREHYPPDIVRSLQSDILSVLAKEDSLEGIKDRLDDCIDILRGSIDRIHGADPPSLLCSLTLGREHYRSDVPQKRIMEALKKRGHKSHPGDTIEFIMSKKGAVLLEDFNGRIDHVFYRRLLCRAAYRVLSPFGMRRDQIFGALDVKQRTLMEFCLTTGLEI